MPSIWNIILHSIISLALLVVAVYVFAEKKMIITGKLTGRLYQLESPAHIVMAASFVILALFFILVLNKNKTIQEICKWLFGLYLVTFFISLFI